MLNEKCSPILETVAVASFKSFKSSTSEVATILQKITKNGVKGYKSTVLCEVLTIFQSIDMIWGTYQKRESGVVLDVLETYV